MLPSFFLVFTYLSEYTVDCLQLTFVSLQLTFVSLQLTFVSLQLTFVVRTSLLPASTPSPPPPLPGSVGGTVWTACQQQAVRRPAGVHTQVARKAITEYPATAVRPPHLQLLAQLPPASWRFTRSAWRTTAGSQYCWKPVERESLSLAGHHQHLVLLVGRRKIAQLTRSGEPETKGDARSG